MNLRLTLIGMVMLAKDSATGYSMTHPANPALLGTHAQVRNTKPTYSPGPDGLLSRIDTEGKTNLAGRLEPFRKVGDPLMDYIIGLAMDEKCVSNVTVEYMQQANHDIDKDHTTPARQAMADYYAHYSRVPRWVDLEELQRGMDVFFKYLPAIGPVLFFRSLLTGFSFPGIAAVLKETSYFNVEKGTGTSSRRLLDTMTYVHTNMMSAESLKPGGRAWKWCLEIRAIHGKVRHRLLNNKINLWDTVHHGVPINPEDNAAILLAFSHSAVQGLDWILPVMTPTEKADYVSLWRYIGWLLGVDTHDDGLVKGELILDPLTGSPESIERTSVEITQHLIETTDYSKNLTLHLLAGTRSNVNLDKDLMFQILAAMSHKWLGADFANALEIPTAKNPVLQVLVFGHLSMLRLYMLVVAKIPLLGRIAMIMNQRLTLMGINIINERRAFRRTFLDGKAGKTTGSTCPLARFFSTMKT